MAYVILHVSKVVFATMMTMIPLPPLLCHLPLVGLCTDPPTDAWRALQAIKLEGGSAVAVAGDVTAPDAPERIVQAAIDSFGRLDVLVNNAGYTWDAVIHKMDPQQWQAMLDVHCTAPFRWAALREMHDVGMHDYGWVLHAVYDIAMHSLNRRCKQCMIRQCMM